MTELYSFSKSVLYYRPHVTEQPLLPGVTPSGTSRPPLTWIPFRTWSSCTTYSLLLSSVWRRQVSEGSLGGSFVAASLPKAALGVWLQACPTARDACQQHSGCWSKGEVSMHDHVFFAFSRYPYLNTLRVPSFIQATDISQVTVVSEAQGSESP